MKSLLFVSLAFAAQLFPLAAQTVPSQTGTAKPFLHPGLFTSRQELDFIKAKVTAKQEPWFGALAAMQKSGAGSLNFKANKGLPFVPPAIHVSFRDKEYNLNALNPWEDSRAAYCQALLWYMTGEKKYAENAAEILNTYAGITDFSGKPDPERHLPDQHMLVGSFWCMGLLQAAEIIKYTSTVWKEADQTKFAESMRKVWYPAFKDFSPGFNGNWDACEEATMAAMGVYLDDRAMFDRAVHYFQNGPDLNASPADEPLWHSMAKYHSDGIAYGSLGGYLDLKWSPDGKQPGFTQETHRDHNANSHEQGGVHAFVQTAEIAWHQGIDLYGMLDNRLCYAVEGVAARATEWEKQFPTKNVKTGRYSPFYEMAFNHYHNRKGLPMPNTEAVLNLPDYRPELARQPYSPNIFGTLTCYGMGGTFKEMAAAGLK